MGCGASKVSPRRRSSDGSVAVTEVQIKWRRVARLALKDDIERQRVEAVARLLPATPRHKSGEAMLRRRAKERQPCAHCAEPIFAGQIANTVGRSDVWVCCRCGHPRPPPTVAAFVDGAVDEGDVDSYRRLAREACEWLVDAVNHAYLDNHIKDIGRLLLVMPRFTGNLHHLLCFNEVLKPGLEARLDFLGAKLHESYLEQRLGEAFAPKVVNRVAKTHRLFRKGRPVEQTAVMPFDPAVFPCGDVEPERMGERAHLHMIIMVGLAVNSRFQDKVAAVASQLGMVGKPQVQPAKPKRFMRACNKMYGDYRGDSFPRGKKNIDVVRALCSPTSPKQTLKFLEALAQAFGGGLAKLKNIYAADAADRAARFHLSCLMATVVFDAGLTYGELAELPETKQLWQTYWKTPDGEPPHRWKEHALWAKKYLQSDALKDRPVVILGEVQLLLPYFCDVRHQMHEVYKAFRAETPHSLLLDFVQTVGPPPPPAPANIVGAAELGLFGRVKRLIEEGTSPDEVAVEGGTNPVFAAAENGHPDVLDVLLKAGASVDLRGKLECTPLHMAAMQGHAGCCRLLVAAGASVDAANTGGHSPLHLAATTGFRDIVAILLEAGADVNAADGSGETPLYKAATSGSAAVVDLMLSAGAAVDTARVSDGATPLFIAAQSGSDAVVRSLLAAKASIDLANKQAIAPMAKAVAKGHAGVVAMLIKAKCDVNAKLKVGNTQMTAIDIALRAQKPDVIDILKKAGATVPKRPSA